MVILVLFAKQIRLEEGWRDFELGLEADLLQSNSVWMLLVQYPPKRRDDVNLAVRVRANNHVVQLDLYSVCTTPRIVTFCVFFFSSLFYVLLFLRFSFVWCFIWF